MGRFLPFCLVALWGTILQLVTRDLVNGIPRKTVPYQPEYLLTFWKSGVSNFSTLLVSEETNTLYVGAKDYILALDLDNISQEITREPWLVPEDRRFECLRRGKSKAECHNYIRVLHKINTTSLYICGTNAFHPACRHYMVINNKTFQLQMEAADGRGKCPFEPTGSYASFMFDGSLYSATSNNFLGTEPIILRSLKNPLRTEFKASWLNEPTFIHMDLVQDSDTSADKIYVFFTEAAVEFEFYDRLLVSRVAQICTGDLGGKRTLRRRWTSFLKSTLACSVPESDFQFNVLQDIFVLKTTKRHQAIFYGIFTQQWGKLDISAICIFRMQTVQDNFQKGNFKGPLSMEGSHTKWVVYRGDIPTPRPGACVGLSAQRQGYNSSLDLPDRVLQFASDHPLMDSTLTPIGRRPALLQRGTKYTKLVVDRTSSLDNETYDILFIGTDKGYLHKAFNCLGEIFLVEGIQLFPSPEPVQMLKLGPQKGLLYAASTSQLVQLPVATCWRYKHCVDCILARDPYCAWSLSLSSCVPVAHRRRDPWDLIQSLRNSDASRCPPFAKKAERHPVALGSSPHLGCSPLSNLAESVWMLNGIHLRVGKARYLFYTHGLVVVNVTGADAGLYECQSIEKAGGREFRVTMAAYLLEPQGQAMGFVTSQHDQSTRRRAGSMLAKTEPGGPLKPGSPARQKQPQSIRGPLFTLMLLSTTSTCLFLFLLSWNIYRGHCPLPWRLGKAEVMKSAGPEPSLELAWRSPAAQSPACKSAPPGGFSGEGRGAEAPRGSRVGLACGAPNCLAAEECLMHRDSHGA